MNRHDLKRHELKNGIAVEIWTEVHRVEKYKIGAAVQTLETIRFILFRDASLKDVSQIYATIHLVRGQPPISLTDHWRFLSYRDA